MLHGCCAVAGGMRPYLGVMHSWCCLPARRGGWVYDLPMRFSFPSCAVAPPRPSPTYPPTYPFQIINGLLELRSVPTGTTLDQLQWAKLQEHLEECAAADAAAAAAAAEQQQADTGSSGGNGAAPPPPPGQGQRAGGGSGGLAHGGGSCDLPGSARHVRGGGGAMVHHRTGSIAASLRVGHIPAGSTDAGALGQVGGQSKQVARCIDRSACFMHQKLHCLGAYSLLNATSCPGPTHPPQWPAR